MSRRTSTIVRASIIGASVALHAWFAFGFAPRRVHVVATRSVTEVDLAAIAPIPVASDPEPAEAPKTPAQVTSPAAPRTAHPTAAAPGRSAPSAAQAGKALTAPENAGPSDIMDFSLVQGEGTAYAGGTTTTHGISRTAVQGNVAPVASAFGHSGPAGAANPVSAVDRSTSPQPLNGNWDCSHLYPAGAAPDFAMVRVVATVDTSGRVISVTVLSDPGSGFGEAAKRCALSQRFSPGLDREGRATVKSTPPIRVRFSR
jgi:protein TonB